MPCGSLERVAGPWAACYTRTSPALPSSWGHSWELRSHGAWLNTLPPSSPCWCACDTGSLRGPVQHLRSHWAVPFNVERLLGLTLCSGHAPPVGQGQRGSLVCLCLGAVSKHQAVPEGVLGE